MRRSFSYLLSFSVLGIPSWASAGDPMNEVVQCQLDLVEALTILAVAEENFAQPSPQNSARAMALFSRKARPDLDKLYMDSSQGQKKKIEGLVAQKIEFTKSFVEGALMGMGDRTRTLDVMLEPVLDRTENCFQAE